jgi:hypothetical protein
MSFLGPLESFNGLFHCLLGMLVHLQVIFLTRWAVASRHAWAASWWNSAAPKCGSFCIVFAILRVRMSLESL